MQVPGGGNVGPGSDILRPELMLEEKETLLEKMKAIGTIFELNFIVSFCTSGTKEGFTSREQTKPKSSC